MIKCARLILLSVYTRYLMFVMWLDNVLNRDDESHYTLMSRVYDYVWGRASAKRERSRYLEGYKDMLRSQRNHQDRLVGENLIHYVNPAKKPLLDRIEQARIASRMIKNSHPNTEAGMAAVFEAKFPLYKLEQIKRQKFKRYKELQYLIGKAGESKEPIDVNDLVEESNTIARDINSLRKQLCDLRRLHE